MDSEKRAAALAAADLIENGMIVGLGTGTTAAFFIQALIDKNLKIKAVASSFSSAKMATEGGIKILDINETSYIDITVDGADEIDPQKRMIKGAGGAHVREKILAAASREMIVVIDESKLVPALGKAKLPVEVLQYGSEATKRHLESLGYSGSWRLNKSGSLLVTDNGNVVFDIAFTTPLLAPEEEHKKIIEVPGVIDTGFFFNLAGRVIIGKADGKIVVANTTCELN